MPNKKLEGNLKISYIPAGSIAQYVPHMTLVVAITTLVLLFFAPKEKIIIQQENGQLIFAQPQKETVVQPKPKKIVGIKELD